MEPNLLNVQWHLKSDLHDGHEDQLSLRHLRVKDRRWSDLLHEVRRERTERHHQLNEWEISSWWLEGRNDQNFKRASRVHEGINLWVGLRNQRLEKWKKGVGKAFERSEGRKELLQDLNVRIGN